MTEVSSNGAIADHRDMSEPRKASVDSPKN
jgi:hypothetical protein